MRNLKKFLALVLALMMVVSVMITVSAKEYTDEKDIDAAYKTAVDAMTNVGVFEGTSDTEFSPTDNITRASMAAIVYRIMTGDVDDDYVELYSGGKSVFTDVTAGSWYEPYVSYCYNSGWLVGDGNGHFMPSDPVTGHQVLAVLLRCLGYTEPGEFEGSNWKIHTAQIAALQGITKGLKADVSLTDELQRQVVAHLTYNATMVAQRVRYTPAFGYTTLGIDGKEMGQLIELGDEKESEPDEWGAPTGGTRDVYFTYPIATLKDKYIIPDPEPDVETWKADDHCDVAKTLGLTKDETYTVYTNGKENKSTVKLQVLNDKAEVGAQGRWTRIYKAQKTIVYVDTVLAKVTDVKAATFDKNDHLKTEATLKLEVYDAKGDKTTATLKNGKTDWTYTKGEYLLVNYHQTTNGKAVSTFDKDNNEDKTTDWKDYYTFVGEADSFTGTQSKIWKNADKHTVDGTDYNDNNRLYLNEAGIDTKGSYTWFLDNSPEGQNVIGVTKIDAATSFGVITRIWWETGSRGEGCAKAEVVYMDGSTDTLEVGNLTVLQTGKPRGTAAMLGDIWGSGSGSLKGGTAVESKDETPMSIDNREFYVDIDYKTNEKGDAANFGILNQDLFRITAAANNKYDFVEVAGSSGNQAPYAGLLTTAATQTISKGQSKNGNVEIDDNTIFLIRSGDATVGYTYSSVVGYNNIDDYGQGEVDYVEAGDGDSFAEYVFITADPKGATSWHTFFATGSYSTNGTDYTFTGYVDGEEGSVVVSNTKQSTLVDALKANSENSMWLVKIVGGYVTDIDGDRTYSGYQNLPVDATVGNGMYTWGQELRGDSGAAMVAKASTDSIGAYEKQSIIAIAVGDKTNKADLNGNNALKVGGKNFNIAGVNPLVGSWSDLETATDTAPAVLYMIYNTDTGVVTQAYVVVSASGVTPTPVPGDPDTLTVTVDNDGVGYDGATKALTTTTDKGTVTFEVTVAHGEKIAVALVSKTDPTMVPAAKATVNLKTSTGSQDVYTVTITGVTEDLTAKVTVKATVDKEAGDDEYGSPSTSEDGKETTAKAPASMSSIYTPMGINLTQSGSKITVEITEATFSENDDTYKLAPNHGSDTVKPTLDPNTPGVVGIVFTPATGETLKDFTVDGGARDTQGGLVWLYVGISKWNAETQKMELIEGLKNTTHTVSYTIVNEKGEGTSYTWTLAFDVK